MGLGQAKAKNKGPIWVSHCLSKYISRELDYKHSYTSVPDLSYVLNESIYVFQ